MRDGWTETALGDIAEVLDRLRKPISGAEREKRIGDVPYYGATGLAGWIDKPIFDEELVLLGEDAIDFLNPDVHKAYLISGPSWVNNHAHVLRAKREKVISFFLMEALNAVDYSQFVAFGTRSKLTQGAMMGISIPVPPIVEQKRIVDVVSSVDAYIDALRHQVDTARTAFLAICEEIFSTGEDMKPLHEVATVIMGQSPEGSTCNTDGTGTPLLAGPTEFTKRTVGPPRQWTSKETKLSQSGDILFCVRGATAGRINIGNYRSVIGRGLAAVRCNNTEDTNLVRFALMVGLGQLLPAAGGTIFPNISQSQLRNFEVSWPSAIRRAELSELVRSIEEVVLRTEQAVEDAKNLRSGLLSALLSGEHEIPASYDSLLGAA